MSRVTKPIMLDETGKDIVEQLEQLNAVAIGVKGDKGDKGDAGISPHVDETTGHWFVGEEDTGVTAKGDKGSEVAASETGTSTEIAKYITIDGDEYKVGGEMSKSDMEAKGMVSSVNGINPVSGNVTIEVSGGGVSEAKKKAELSYYRYLEDNGGDATKPYMKALRSAALDMDEFKKLGSGLFIHWGVYSVPAGTYTGQKVDTATMTTTKLTRNCEWALRDLGIPLDVYRDFQDQFTGTEFDADEVAQMAVDCGMKYIIITAKHHEGFSLYPTNYGQWDIRESACRTTILDELKAACDARGLKFGVYYSQYWDWEAVGGYGLNHGGKWTTTDPYTSTQHQDYIAKTAKQLEELVNKYNPYILWYDPGTNYTDGCKETLRAAESNYPQVICNNRLGYNRDYGDYGTGERTIYLDKTLAYGESCFTLNNTWGYSQNNETESWYYSPETIFKEFWLYTISYGQNCLMNIGPKADGSIPDLTKTRWNQMKTFIQNYCNGGFYDYSKVSETTRPSWGYMIQQPGNKIMCYILTYNNTNYENIILDGVDTTGLKTENGVVIKTAGSNATYTILDNYRIQINGLALDQATKIGVVELNYESQPFAVDAFCPKAGEYTSMSVFPVNKTNSGKYTIKNKTYLVKPSNNWTLEPATMIWCDDNKYCSAQVDSIYSSNQSGTCITQITVTDKADSTKTKTFSIETTKLSPVYESEEVFYFEKDHKYTVSYKVTGTDANEFTCKAFTFVENAATEITNMEVNPDDPYTLAPEEEKEYTVLIEPANYLNKDFTFKTDNSAIKFQKTSATTFKLWAEGTTDVSGNTVTITSAADENWHVDLTVNYQTIKPTSITVTAADDTIPVNVENATTATATVLPANATNMDVTWSCTGSIEVTQIEQGKCNVKSLSEAGTATIIATSVADNTVVGSAQITVVDTAVIDVTSISLDNQTLDLMECESTYLTATIEPTTATYQNVTWNCENSNIILTVDDSVANNKKVKVTAKEGFSGTAIITAAPEHQPATALSAQCEATVSLETTDYLFEVDSLSGDDGPELQDTNIMPFSDEETDWTLFGWAQGSVNPASATNATLYQCVVNSSAWSGLRIDADNNASGRGITSSTPAALRPRWTCSGDAYFSMQSASQLPDGGTHDPVLAEDTVIHPFYFSRQGTNYYYSFDGKTWNTTLYNATQINRLKTCPLTVGYDYKRASGALTTERYRLLKTEGLYDSRACVAFKRTAKYKFAKHLKNYDSTVEADYNNSITALTAEAE